jgi:hypothetical protein
MIVSGGNPLSSAQALSEPKFQALNLSLATKLEFAKQGVSTLIINLKSPDLSGSQKSFMLENAKNKLNEMSEGLALIREQKDVVAASSYELKGLYEQKLNIADKEIKADYKALKYAINSSEGGRLVTFAPVTNV